MRVLTFASFKGGSGKTTTAIATAAALIDGGQHRVFVLDLDNRQNSLFRWLNDTRRVYGNDAPDKSVLDGAAIALEGEQPEAISAMHGFITKASREYDICIIDTQGTQNPVSITAMRFTDLVIVPVQISGIEIEPFVATYKLAQTAVSFEDAKVVGLVTRMQNFASTTMIKTREVLARYGIEIVDGTSQRDGYQQLVYESGTFEMIRRKFADEAEAATDSKARRRALNECSKVEAARDETLSMLGRLGILETSPEEKEA